MQKNSRVKISGFYSHCIDANMCIVKHFNKIFARLAARRVHSDRIMMESTSSDEDLALIDIF